MLQMNVHYFEHIFFYHLKQTFGRIVSYQMLLLHSRKALLTGPEISGAQYLLLSYGQKDRL